MVVFFGFWPGVSGERVWFEELAQGARALGSIASVAGLFVLFVSCDGRVGRECGFRDSSVFSSGLLSGGRGRDLLPAGRWRRSADELSIEGRGRWCFIAGLSFGGESGLPDFRKMSVVDLVA